MKRVLLLAAMSAIGGNAIAADLSPPVAYPPHVPRQPTFPLRQLIITVGLACISAAISVSAGAEAAAFQIPLAAPFQQRPTPNFSVVSNSASTMNSQEASWLALRPCSMGFQILETQ